jgi:hypothetical protein
MTIVDQAVRRETDRQGALYDANPETTVEEEAKARYRPPKPVGGSRVVPWQTMDAAVP